MLLVTSYSVVREDELEDVLEKDVCCSGSSEIGGYMKVMHQNMFSFSYFWVNQYNLYIASLLFLLILLLLEVMCGAPAEMPQVNKWVSPLRLLAPKGKLGSLELRTSMLGDWIIPNCYRNQSYCLFVFWIMFPMRLSS